MLSAAGVVSALLVTLGLAHILRGATVAARRLLRLL